MAHHVPRRARLTSAHHVTAEKVWPGSDHVETGRAISNRARPILPVQL